MRHAGCHSEHIPLRNAGGEAHQRDGTRHRVRRRSLVVDRTPQFRLCRREPKSAGRIPTTVSGSRLTVTRLPMTAGFAANARRQRSSEMTTRSIVPARPSPSSNPRPRIGRTPSMSNRPRVTNAVGTSISRSPLSMSEVVDGAPRPLRTPVSPSTPAGRAAPRRSGLRVRRS